MTQPNILFQQEIRLLFHPIYVTLTSIFLYFNSRIDYSNVEHLNTLLPCNLWESRVCLVLIHGGWTEALVGGVWIQSGVCWVIIHGGWTEALVGGVLLGCGGCSRVLIGDTLSRVHIGDTLQQTI